MAATAKKIAYSLDFCKIRIVEIKNLKFIVLLTFKPNIFIYYNRSKLKVGFLTITEIRLHHNLKKKCISKNEFIKDKVFRRNSANETTLLRGNNKSSDDVTNQ